MPPPQVKAAYTYLIDIPKTVTSRSLVQMQEPVSGTEQFHVVIGAGSSQIIVVRAQPCATIRRFRSSFPSKAPSTSSFLFEERKVSSPCNLLFFGRARPLFLLPIAYSECLHSFNTHSSSMYICAALRKL